ncbi:MAG: hypothetical protein LBG60_11080 [Bifidobacteriaceae bacterium]|jgi:hypothetical protein|nr:hypothetical protein [Bifidobacteriaceae bacterium]
MSDTSPPVNSSRPSQPLEAPAGPPPASPYDAITPRRSGRRALLGALALTGLFAAGWFGRDLAYPSVTSWTGVSGTSITSPEDGALTDVVIESELHPKGWPALTVQSVRVDGCLEVETDPPEASPPIHDLYCDIQPDAVYVSHGDFGQDGQLPGTLVIMDDAEPRATIEIAPWAPAGTVATARPPVTVHHGESAALILFWRLDPAERRDRDTQCQGGEDEGWQCEWQDFGATPLVVTVELRSALGITRTERMNLQGIAQLT